MAKAETPRVACVLKLRPTCAQEATFQRWLWHLTAVYNFGIRTLERNAERGNPLSKLQTQRLVVGHGPKIGVSQDALNATILTAHTAWTRHRRGLARRPRLKGQRNKLNSIAFDHGLNGRSAQAVRNGRFPVPGIGRVRFHRQGIPEGHIGCMRIVRRASGWYLVLFMRAEPRAIPRVAHGSIGIDPGFSSLLTLSTGEKIEHPQEFRAAEQRLGQAQRGRRQQLTARLRERIANRVRNRNHHLSRRLVSENTLIAFSVDPSSAIARRFGKSVSSASHYQLRSQLQSKCRTGGSKFIEVPSRNSTKRCSACGLLSGPSGIHRLSVRTWVCACGALWDRDINAARNTLASALGTSVEMGREAQSGIAQ